MIARKIEEHLENRGMSIREAARGTGIPERQLEDMLAGRTELDFASYSLLCSFLDVPIESFFDQDGASN